MLDLRLGDDVLQYWSGLVSNLGENYAWHSHGDYDYCWRYQWLCWFD